MKRKIIFAFTVTFFILMAACSSQVASVPTIKSIELLDKNSNPLPVTDGWINLQADSVIKITYEGEATQIEFYTAPTGTETLLEQRIIGNIDVKKEDKTAQLEWKVPHSFLGYIWVVVYNEDVARTSNTSEFFIKAIYE